MAEAENLPEFDPSLPHEIESACRDLDWLSRRFRSILDLGSKAQGLLLLLRREVEIHDRVIALETKEAALKQTLLAEEAAQARLDNLGAEISARLAAAEETAKTAADGILASAQEEAGHLLANAKTAAEDVAHRQAEAHAEAVAQREAKIVELDGVIEARESTAAALDTRINTANRALSALRSKLS
jgi:chromosome segregation ATPase